MCGVDPGEAFTQALAIRRPPNEEGQVKVKWMKLAPYGLQEMTRRYQRRLNAAQKAWTWQTSLIAIGRSRLCCTTCDSKKVRIKRALEEGRERPAPLSDAEISKRASTAAKTGWQNEVEQSAGYSGEHFTRM